MTKPIDVWGEDENYPRQDWQFEVANGDTNLGYWNWVMHQEEVDRFDREFEAKQKERSAKKPWWEE